MDILGQLLALLLIPALTLLWERHIKWPSAIVLCYALGIIAGRFLGQWFNADLVQHALEGTVVLAIPLLLFQSDVRQWIRNPDRTVLAFGLAVLATLTAAISGYLLFSNALPESPAIASMLSGVYSGGTINMSAIAVAIEAPPNLFILLNAYDVLFSSFYFLFLISIGRPLLNLVLSKSEHHKKEASVPTSLNKDRASRKEWMLGVLTSLGWSMAIGGISVGASLILFQKMSATFIILMVSTLAVFASLRPSIKQLSQSYSTGNYLLLVFAFSIGVGSDFQQLLSTSTDFFWMALYIFCSSILLHFILCKVAQVDAIAFMITSTAAVFGPPFIGPVASAWKRKDVILPGLTVAILGNVVGTYLGIVLYALLEKL